LEGQRFGCKRRIAGIPFSPVLKHKAIVSRVRHPAWNTSRIPRDGLFPTALTPLRSGTIHETGQSLRAGRVGSVLHVEMTASVMLASVYHANGVAGSGSMYGAGWLGVQIPASLQPFPFRILHANSLSVCTSNWVSSQAKPLSPTLPPLLHHD